ncbi:restriction endonuclease subunit S [Fibrobacter sp. UWH3]|uniref:restriction endonuclease subunit S n=1 Tax=Fibrobacter sp. UWH3 TaxID=1964353 RepID=UPI0011323E13|nr:restriction endonuclease subunit S [Fibrobacter sp. UWH3]
MKKNWEYKKLGDVCEIVCGQDYKSVQDDNGPYPIYGTGGIMGYASQYRCPEGSVIVGRKGSINNPLYVETKFWNVDTAFGIVPNGETLQSKFFFYFCRQYDFTKHDVSVTIPSLRRTDIMKIDIPVPPMSEQERIVAELDLLNGVLEKQKAQLKELDALAQSIFYDMFGDLEMKDFVLVDLCKSKDDIKCGPFGTQLSKAEYKKEGIAVWGIPQINSRFSILPTDFVTHEKAEALKDYSVIPGDIVMSRKGNVGQCSVFPYSFEPGIIHSDVLRLRLNENVANPVFMEYQLHLSDMIKHQIQLVSSGAIMPGINVTKLKSIRVQVPPLPLQQAFADKIASIESQKAAINQSIAETQKLLDYTMDKYFG